MRNIRGTRFLFSFLALFSTLSSVGLQTGCATITESILAPSSPSRTNRDWSGAPRAEIQPHELKTHDDVRIDKYFWLRERENPNVLDYLGAENAYTQKVMSPMNDLQEKLFQEIKARVAQDDSTVPEKDGEFFYYTRFETGKEYPILCRRKGSMDAPENVMLDANKLAEGRSYFHVAQPRVSPDGKKLAFAIDTLGRRIYTIHFKDLTTGQMLEEKIVDVTADFEWAEDSQTLFYTKQNPKTLRPEFVYRHKLGENRESQVYHESDETFDVGIHKSLSRKFIFIIAASTLTTEFRYLDAKNPMGSFKIFLPRVRGHEYQVEDGGDRFFIRSNDKAKNFRLMETAYDKIERKNWKDVVPERSDTLLEDFTVFRTHLALQERRNGLTRIHVIDRRGNTGMVLPFKDPVYMVGVARHREFDTKLLRYEYESLTTPESIYEFNLETGVTRLCKRTEVGGGFDPENYESRRAFAKAEDGAMIPVSLVYRKTKAVASGDKPLARPLVIEGYGAYGLSEDPYFRRSIFSLLDRGFVYAIAHVRGGSEMGRSWYENGKLLKKRNTFTDFIAVTEYLQSQGYGSDGHTYAIGGSAGGLLMGAIMNMRPELYNGIIAAVPFVDVVTTMLDTSIPLTTSEFDEWGNPVVREYYDYIKSYSPYDNVTAKAYPHLFVTTGLHDSQVQYWEPAKWVAKLRELKTDNNLVLMHVNMEVGHDGKSGRFQVFKDTALEYAFLLQLEGVLH